MWEEENPAPKLQELSSEGGSDLLVLMEVVRCRRKNNSFMVEERPIDCSVGCLYITIEEIHK